MTLRVAKHSDLRRVMEITKNVIPLMIDSGNTQWSGDYPNEARFMQDINDGTLFVFEETDIKGFVVIDGHHAEAYETITWTVPNFKSQAMHRMAVDPNFQGQGIATKIFKEAEKLIASAGFKGIHTDTSLENKTMQNMFEKNGYQFREKIHLDDNIDDWYVAYEKVL
jgi:ribosomal protein S18 acetylase RimI-like enzyme